MTRQTAQTAAALIIALAALAGLVLQFLVGLADNPGALATIWSLLRYFTILTNIIVLLVFARMALSGRAAAQWVLAATTLWILIVGIVFWGLINEPGTLRTGRDWWANMLVHTASPVGVGLWWLVFAGKDALRFWHPIAWLFWPIGYAIYGVGRGLIDGKYPYFFLDLDALGWGGLLTWVLILAAAFAAGAFALVGLARALSR